LFASVYKWQIKSANKLLLTTLYHEMLRGVMPQEVVRLSVPL